MSASQPIPAHVIDEATDWLVLLHSGEVTELQLQQFEQWKAEKQQNALAIQQIERLTHGLSNLPSNFQPELLVSSEKNFIQHLKEISYLAFRDSFFLDSWHLVFRGQNGKRIIILKWVKLNPYF